MNFLRNLSSKKDQYTSKLPQYWEDFLIQQVREKYGRDLAITGTVLAVLRNEEAGMELIIPGLNIVTDAGDLYYAERGCNETPTNFTTGATWDGIMELYNGASAAPAKGNDRSDMAGLVTGSAQDIDATYPQTNDADGDNTGAGVDIVTYRRSYTTAQANAATISDVIITNPTPGASEPLLNQAEFTPFTKTSSDTLKVFVNHEMLGV